MNEPRIGVLLCNVGTPDAPQTAEVRRYLREFLSDPRVLDINPIGRWLLLNLIILPTRPAKSAEAYRKIWTDEGSPLTIHGEALASAVADRIGRRFDVRLAMRYGNPSIRSQMESLRAAGCEHVVVFPLYPHYAASSTGTVLEEVFRCAGKLWNVPSISVVPPFYDDPGFLDALCAVGRPVIDTARSNHILFSFHGLPERHMRKSDPTGAHCFSSDSCCDAIGPQNRWCYRAQCHHTAREMVTHMGLQDGGWTVTFQSRLGRTPWIQPYTDEVLVELAQKGIKRLVVFCPAFVADCLETLEEIGMRAHHDFKAAGGESVTLVPSLNSTAVWADAATQLILRAAPSV